MKIAQQPITKDLIAQHNLTDDEYKKIVEISVWQTHDGTNGVD